MDLVKLLAKLQTIGVTEEKKPDADGDGVPDWADKKPGADDTEDKKEKANEDIENVLRKLQAIQEGNNEDTEVDEAVKVMRKDQFTGDFERYSRDATDPDAQAHRDQTAAAMKDFRKQTGISGAKKLAGDYRAKQAGLNIHSRKTFEEEDVEEGNEFAQKVQQLKAQGAKPGTKFKTSDGKEHVLEAEEACEDCGKVHEGACKEEDLKECDMSPLSSMGGMEQQATPDRYTLTIQRGDKNLNVTTDNPAELLQLMKLAGVTQGAEVQQAPAEEQEVEEDWGNTPAQTNEPEPRGHGDIRDWGLPGTAKAKVRYTPQQQGDNPMESKMFEEYKQFKQGK